MRAGAEAGRSRVREDRQEAMSQDIGGWGQEHVQEPWGIHLEVSTSELCLRERGAGPDV